MAPPYRRRPSTSPSSPPPGALVSSHLAVAGSKPSDPPSSTYAWLLFCFCTSSGVKKRQGGYDFAGIILLSQKAKGTFCSHLQPLPTRPAYGHVAISF